MKDAKVGRIAIKRTKPLWYNNLVSVIPLEQYITAIRCRVGINYQLTKQEALELK